MRLPDAFVGNVGRTATVEASYDAGRVTLAIDGAAPRRARYVFGPWSVWLLVPRHSVGPGWARVLNAVFVFAAMIPVGWLFRMWQRSPLQTAVLGGVTLGSLLFVIPRASGLAAGPPLLWLAGAVGYLVGIGLTTLVPRRRTELEREAARRL